jgi:hypothetical protein
MKARLTKTQMMSLTQDAEKPNPMVHETLPIAEFAETWAEFMTAK